jgi:hypothetical protein
MRRIENENHSKRVRPNPPAQAQTMSALQMDPGFAAIMQAVNFPPHGAWPNPAQQPFVLQPQLQPPPLNTVPSNIVMPQAYVPTISFVEICFS